MISQKLSQMIAESMKKGDFLRTETLRMLSSSFNYERIAVQHELSGEEELKVIQKQAKQRRDSIEAYKKAGAEDRAKKEEDELEILKEFLPPEMSEEEVMQLVSSAIDTLKPNGMGDMGKIIGMVKSQAPNVDGGKIATLVKQKLEASV